MDNNLLLVILFATIGGVVSLIGGVILLSSKRSANALAEYATPFAGGALLAAVFLDLLKEGVETGPSDTVLMAALIGMVIFFLAEGFLHWFHHHHQHEGDPKDPSVWLIIIGDTVHNALDGVAIAASFLISVPTGVVTTIAVAAHEIPQEIGDFGLMLGKGMSRRAVLLVNFLSALATVVFAIITYKLGSQETLPIGALLGLSAGFLLYIAASDIIPTIHESNKQKHAFSIQALMLVLGVIVVGLATNLSHKYIDTKTTDPINTNHIEECLPQSTLNLMGAPAPGTELPPACQE